MRINIFDLLVITGFSILGFFILSTSNSQLQLNYSYSENGDSTGNVTALLEEADDLYIRGQYPEAIKYYDMVLSISPNDTYAITGKGDSLYNLEKYREAIKLYEDALAINSSETYALTSIAVSYYSLGMYQEALEYYDDALKINATDTFALDGKAASLYTLGQYQQAIKYYAKALAINASDTYALNGIGDSLYELEKYQDALRQFETVLRIDPNDPYANTSRQEILSQNLTEESPKSYPTTKGYIQLSQDEWLVDPISLYIEIDPSIENATEYINIASEAIDRWSELLKEKSANYSAWNFIVRNSLDNPSIEEISDPVDVVVGLVRSNLGADCATYLGLTELFPLDRTVPVYSYIFISCDDIFEENFLPREEVYSLIGHEFGHVLGLDHTFESEGDLMCPGVYESSTIDSGGCTFGIGRNEPSDLNIDALLYKYGVEGFSSPNRKVVEQSRFDFNMKLSLVSGNNPHLSLKNISGIH